MGNNFVYTFSVPEQIKKLTPEEELIAEVNEESKMIHIGNNTYMTEEQFKRSLAVWAKEADEEAKRMELLRDLPKNISMGCKIGNIK